MKEENRWHDNTNHEYIGITSTYTYYEAFFFSFITFLLPIMKEVDQNRIMTYLANIFWL